MTLTEIASFINLGVNNQLSLEQVSLVMDSVQKNAFQTNQQAFLVYDQKLTILTKLSFSASSLDSADVGGFLDGDTSGTRGTIVAIYDNYVTLSDVDGEYQAGETATVNASNSLVVSEASAFQTGWRGPYQAPTDPQCRKIWGVTLKPPHIFWIQYLNRCGYWFSINGIWQTADYRAFWGNRLYPFVTGNTYDLQNQFLFSYDPIPEANAQHPYYWVYWKNPPSITGLDDSDSLLIPEAYHFHFANACQQFAKAFLEGGVASLDKITQDNLSPWVDTLLAPFRDQWRNSNMTQNRGAFLS